VTLDANGKELTREALRWAGGTRRIALPADPPAPQRAPQAARLAEPIPIPEDLPIKSPKPGLRADEWNRVEIFLDANIIRTFINTDRESGNGVAEDPAGRYGPIALYTGNSGEVRFKELAYKDLGFKFAAHERVANSFRMQALNEFYYAWSEAAADFNKDGVLDVIAGPYIYFGPQYTRSREIYLAQTSNPSREYATECMIQLAGDVTADGWPDVICSNLGTPVYVYVNPKGESRRWDKHLVIPRIQTEIMDYRDMDGDGKPELVYGADGYIRYAKPDPARPTEAWIVRDVSARGYVSGHGIGTGDINGDGRMDIINVYGWWEQPPAGSRQERWTYHPEAFGRVNRSSPGGALMGAYDINGDGLTDVVASIGAHDFGLAWYEQKRDGAGKISFVRHFIMDDYWSKNAGKVAFSQSHGAAFGDVDGDGVPDFIVGKRFWSHQDAYYDPDPYSDPVLYWYRTARNPKAPGGAEFVPELIHNRSGAGSTILAVDLNKDGALDIVTATDRGAFIFWGKRGAKAPGASGN
jgi:hypothetical protein